MTFLSYCDRDARCSSVCVFDELQAEARQRQANRQQSRLGCRSWRNIRSIAKYSRAPTGPLLFAAATVRHVCAGCWNDKNKSRMMLFTTTTGGLDTFTCQQQRCQQGKGRTKPKPSKTWLCPADADDSLSSPRPRPRLRLLGLLW